MAKRTLGARYLMAATCALALAGCQHAAPIAERDHARPSLMAPAAPPPGMTPVGIEWGRVEVPGVGAVLTAVARPAGRGPFPSVIILHGTHGFARDYVQLAQDLSKTGVLAVAACWFAPGEGAGKRFVSPLTCPPDAPPITGSTSDQAARTVEALVGAVRTLPDVRPDRIALFGHSRGGGAAWNHVLRGGVVQALVLNSAGYPPELVERASQFGAPVLILHGAADSPADGGSTMTDAARARAFEVALRQAGKPVEAVYYENGRHNGLFSDTAQHEDEVLQAGAYLRRILCDR